MSTRARAVPGSRAARMRRALALAAGCGVLSVGLCACESTEQESSRIGHESEAAAKAAAAPKTTTTAHTRARPHSRARPSAHASHGKASASR
jgi:hypothetical protein